MFASQAGTGTWQSVFEVFFPETERIELTINSQLFSSANIGELGFIDRNAVQIEVGQSIAVPEPMSLGFAVALFGLTAIVRRR